MFPWLSIFLHTSQRNFDWIHEKKGIEMDWIGDISSLKQVKIKNEDRNIVGCVCCLLVLFTQLHISTLEVAVLVPNPSEILVQTLCCRM